MANNNHFNLDLDTLIPSATITRPAEFMHENANCTITRSKEAAAYMRVWFDKKATGDAADAPAWEAYAATKATNFTSDGVYYAHIQVKDDVENVSAVADSTSMTFDTVLPTVGDNTYLADPDSGSKIITNNRTGVKYHAEFTDPGSPASGVNHLYITGDTLAGEISVEISSGSSYDGTLDFAESAPQGLQTVYVWVTDKAGNASASKTVTITLDTELEAPVLALTKRDHTTAIPAYINYHDISANLTSTDTDIIGYKIWEGSTEPTDWTAPTAGIALNVWKDISLSAGDGAKVMHAKVKDAAGTEKSATDVTVTVDTVLPVASIDSITSTAKVGDIAIISNVTGFNSATITYTVSDALSGIKEWILKCNEITLASGDQPVAAGTATVTTTQATIEGNNTITLTVVDLAENTNTATGTIIKDTTAPTASIGTLNAWYNAYFDISVTYADAHSIASISSWVSANALDETVPSGTTPITPTSSPAVIASGNITWSSIAQSDSNYMHSQVVDIVGNKITAHAKFGYDNVAPDKPTIAFTQSAYPSTSASVNISATDATSGVAKMRVTGDITNGTGADAWEDYATSRSVTLTAGDGMKYVTVIVKDTAGNVSTTSERAGAELDTSKPTGTISLYEADGTTSKPAHSPLATLSAHIGVTDDAVTDCQYKLYGDFTYDSQQAQGITEETAEWKNYVPETGKDYMLIGNMFCTSGDGTKTIYVKIKDNAGNVSDAVYASFVYDTTRPIVVVSGVDYNRISKVHQERQGASGPITGKYADEVHFTSTPDSVIQAYKVCAYLTQEAAAAGSAADPVIPSTAGSVNMSASGISSSAPIEHMIKGADYETALGGTGHDGVHIVTVYVQDLAGQWSEAAVFLVTSY